MIVMWQEVLGPCQLGSALQTGTSLDKKTGKLSEASMVIGNGLVGNGVPQAYKTA